MLTWFERKDAQKKAAGPVAKAPAAKASCEAPLTCLNGRSADAPHAGRLSSSDPGARIATGGAVGPPPPDAKALATLAAQYAIAGHELRREVGIDGGERYHVVRLGWLKPLRDLDAARVFLAQIGSAQ